MTKLNGHPKIDFDPLTLVSFQDPSKPDQKKPLLDVYIIAATKHAAPLDGPRILYAQVKWPDCQTDLRCSIAKQN